MRYKMWLIPGGCVAAFLCALATGCGAPPAKDATGSTQRPRIVATVGMVADAVRQIGGTRFEVVGLIGEGLDPHLYAPTRNDIALLEAADAVFYGGLMLEGQLGSALEQLRSSGKPVVAVAEGLDRAKLRGGSDDASHPDPHVWMDVGLWGEVVDVIRDALITLDPAGAPQFRAAAAAYRAELSRLDAYVREVIASVPLSQRVLVTAHDAFGYFGQAYGVRVEGIQGVSTESEAGLEDINRLVALIVEQRVPAVFVETSVADKNVRALIEGARARGHNVRIGGALFSDAMGAAGSYEGSYIGMLDHNATVIARALGGQAPVRGMNGRLSAQPGESARQP